MLLAGLLLAGLAHAQGNQQVIDTCYSPTASDDDSITSCTALIQSGQYSGVELSHYYNSRATGYIGKGLFDLALQDFNTAILLDPTNAQAYKDRGDIYYKRGDYNAALAGYNQAISLLPSYAHAYAARAEARQKLRDAAGAQADEWIAWGALFAVP